ncbi:hypothetical protein BZARG_2643 [Bizionia argentinensis JUB59]|uniref:Uncharacterized protein n=1 Tax=Bizionia argentinensis JUB59 TaxID=1046627 RepID=G2EDA0_9FLAO|nr:hypothetical protein [Bizionia argentinensis]EGV43587.1 hypothetical protein BZARG_2643 [Bizionia argentinensis JUB59]
MTLLIPHIKLILEPVLEEQGLSITDVSIPWENICDGFLQYELDSKPLYTELYRMELNNPEQVISQLDTLHNVFMTDLAEDFVLGIRTDYIKPLLTKEASLLNKKITFLSQLKVAITKTERQRIVQDLDEMSQRAAFVIPETTLESALKKKTRADLRNQFNTWDKELEELEEFEEFEVKKHIPELESNIFKKKSESNPETLDADTKDNSSKSRVISLSWVKYAVAASVLIMAGIFYFKSFPTTDNSIPVFANVETSTQTVPVIVNQGMGYVSSVTDQQIEIVVMDYTNRIDSINKVLIDNDDSVYKNELERLQLLENTYVFDENKLTVHLKDINKQFNIIYLNDVDFYLNIRDQYYSIVSSDAPTKLVAENDERIIEQLEKIIFENE